MPWNCHAEVAQRNYPENEQVSSFEAGYADGYYGRSADDFGQRVGPYQTGYAAGWADGESRPHYGVN